MTNIWRSGEKGSGSKSVKTGAELGKLKTLYVRKLEWSLIKIIPCKSRIINLRVLSNSTFFPVF